MGMGMGTGDVSLGQAVKAGQKASNNWKQAWAKYVEAYGNGFNDPNKYAQEFLVDFFDYLGELGTNDLATQPVQESRKRAGAENSGPPSKRANVGAWGASSEKAQLVEKVKALQRSNEE